jgi:glycosyltransferase involved in cell wall biosynthesis
LPALDPDVAPPPADKLPLTVAIIAKNAAGQLGACLASVGFAGEVLVVDSGSTDETVALAESRGARILQHDWLGFGKQKQLAVQGAANEWVLCLDADERVTPELAASIRAALAAPRYKAYRLARRNRFLGVWLAHGEGYPDWTIRLFHRTHANWSSDEVHETVLTTTEVGRLAGDLLHESAEDIATYVAKQNRYTTLHAEALYRQGVRASAWRLFVNPLVRFVKFYVFKRGFLDGAAGFAHVAIGCNNTFHKYLKILELQRAGASHEARGTR